MKAKIKSILATSLYHSGLLRSFQNMKQRSSATGDAVILMYHRVVEDLDAELLHTQAGMMVTRSTFERQLATLRDRYRVMSLLELVECIRTGKKPPPRTVAITFDDGWRDNYVLAYPLLKKYQLPATIFLTTDYIGSDRTFWFHRIGLALATQQLSHYELRYAVNSQCRKSGEEVPAQVEAAIALAGGTNGLDRYLESIKSLRGSTLENIAQALWDRLPPGNQRVTQRWLLNWDEVNAMKGDLVQFGSHGRSHRIATGIDIAKIEAEFRVSRDAIAARVGQSADLLAYPNGNFSAEVIEAAKKAGYSGAVTTAFRRDDPGPDTLFTLRRVGIHEGMSVDNRGQFSNSAFVFGISGWRDKLQGNL